MYQLDNKKTYCLNAYKRTRNQTELLRKNPIFKSPSSQHISHMSKPNHDLLNISLVSPEDYTSRQIVRRKSNIDGSLI